MWHHFGLLRDHWSHTIIYHRKQQKSQTTTHKKNTFLHLHDKTYLDRHRINRRVGEVNDCNQERFTQRGGPRPSPLSTCWQALRWDRAQPGERQSPGRSFPWAASSSLGSSSAWQSCNTSVLELYGLHCYQHGFKSFFSTCRTPPAPFHPALWRCRWECDQSWE